MTMYIIEAMLNGEWVEVCRTTNGQQANSEYEQIAGRRGSKNVRVRTEG